MLDREWKSKICTQKRQSCWFYPRTGRLSTGYQTSSFVGGHLKKDLEDFIRREAQRDQNVTKMTYHKYPNEWLPTIEFSDIQCGFILSSQGLRLQQTHCFIMKPVKTDRGQYQLTKKISTNGYCIVRNCPTAKDSVQKVANCITPVIPSFYGNTFDVVSTENAINVAYTNVELPLHMDLIYMESAPGLQVSLVQVYDEHFPSTFCVVKTIKV